MFSKKGRKKDDLSSISHSGKSPSDKIVPLAPSFEEGFYDLEKLDLSEIKKLLSIKTDKTHKKAFKIVKELGLTSFQRWEKIHSNASLKPNFSKASVDLVNDFAHMVLIYLENTSRILELGCGFGNDALFIADQTQAYVTAVDCSQTAIKEAKKLIKPELKIDFICQDYQQTLKDMKDANLDMIYCHSAAHYWPAYLFEESLLSAVVQCLSPSGVFCLVMKTADSASTEVKDQIHLSSEEAPYLYTLSKKDRLFSMYPKSKEILFEALDKHFDIAYEEVVEVEGYAKFEQVEVFICVVARPKKKMVEES